MELPTLVSVPASLEVVVHFGASVPADAQGIALLALERLLRERGHPVQVVKETMPDDLKSRARMTLEERSKL